MRFAFLVHYPLSFDFALFFFVYICSTGIFYSDQLGNHFCVHIKKRKCTLKKLKGEGRAKIFSSPPFLYLGSIYFKDYVTSKKRILLRDKFFSPKEPCLFILSAGYLLLPKIKRKFLVFSSPLDSLSLTPKKDWRQWP